MRRQVLTAIAVLVGVLLVSAPMLAHHGDAAYDTTKVVTVKGTVAQFNFINPHVEIFIDVKGENGKVERWQGELTSPNMLARRGWTKSTLKLGEEITLAGYRAKNGAPSLRLQKVIGADGKQIYPGGGSDY